jgi:broad-specificity NMP kinase
MKNKIYFVGGAKGVGKTSLLNSAEIKSKGLKIVNTGDFFHRAKKIYNYNIKENAKKDLLNYLINNSPLITDTHYAGFSKEIYTGEFERALFEDELDILASNCELELF